MKIRQHKKNIELNTISKYGKASFQQKFWQLRNVENYIPRVARASQEGQL